MFRSGIGYYWMEEGGRRGGWGGWVQHIYYSFSKYVHIVSMLFRVLFFYYSFPNFMFHYYA